MRSTGIRAPYERKQVLQPMYNNPVRLRKPFSSKRKIVPKAFTRASVGVSQGGAKRGLGVGRGVIWRSQVEEILIVFCRAQGNIFQHIFVEAEIKVHRGVPSERRLYQR